MDKEERYHEILRLWNSLSAAPFPSGCRGREVAEIDLVLLDSTIAGCISAFLESKGLLDLRRTALLGLCLRDLVMIVGILGGEAQAYFRRLEEATCLVLEMILDSNQ